MKQQNQAKLNQADQLFQQAFGAHRAGRLEEAMRLYRRVLKLTPDDMESLYLLGTACSQGGDFEGAARHLRAALKLSPDHVPSLNNLGLTLKGMGQTEQALTHYRRAVALDPGYADAHNNIGNALELLGRLDEAEPALRRALELAPDLADAHCNLGLVLMRRDRFEEATQCFLRGIALQPEHAVSHDFLGQIYKVWGRFDAALACMDRAVALNPGGYSPHNNRGAILEALGRYDEALLEYQEAARIKPDETDARWNQAFLFLRQGMLERGWEAHELRLQAGGQVSIRFPYPQWDGSSLAGKTLLIYAEQGLGDEILFASCVPDAMALAAHCVIECAPRLGALFKRAFPGATVVAAGRMEIGWLLEAPRIDVQVAAGSLPRFLRPTLQSFPARPGYLLPDAARAAHWRARVALLGPGLKIGVCWRSGLATGERHKYYSELTQWGEILGVPGVHFVNLQYGECGAELDAARAKFGVPITVFDELDLREQIDESAALMAAMDLVIAAPTAVLETAGALGVPCFRIDAYGKQWTALGRGDHMPWHPNTRLFAQSSPGDWDTELALVAAALREKVAGHAAELAWVTLADGVELAVDGAADDLSRYVLAEQGKWFDAEYDFVLGLARPGMRALDIGAGVGAYALPLARRVGHGQVYALGQGAADIDLLMRSRLRNGLEQSLQIAIADAGFSLDARMDQHGLDQVALVRLAGALCSEAVLASGTRFFALNSPLVMFAVAPGAPLDAGPAGWLAARGYELFRLVPGLDLLVPCVSADELDVYALNLFACKPERAAQLEREGRLTRRIEEPADWPGIEQRHWQAYLAGQPYAADLLALWDGAAGREGDWEVYWMALNLYAQARSSAVDAAQRHARLLGAASALASLAQQRATLPRLLSLCRVLIDLGRRETAVGVLNLLCELLHGGLDMALAEPCLALAEPFAQMRPGARAAEWALAMVLAQREQWRAFSSYFTGQDGLPALEEVVALGFAPAGLDRKISLIRSRFGISCR